MSPSSTLLAAAALLGGLWTLAPGRSSPSSGALESLVQAERAFARSARADGASAAFLEVLAEDGTVFSPRPVDGRGLHTDHPWPREYVLEWHPRVAAVSAAGDLGYTSGPYVFKVSPEAETAAYGHYFSVWRRESADDPWKLVLDIGTPHARVGDEEQVVGDVREFPEVGAASTWARDEAVGELRAAVERLHGVLDGGAGDGLEALALEAVQVYRTGMVPAVGRDALAERAGLADAGSSRSWEVLGGWVGGAQDLGVVWGGWEVKEARVPGDEEADQPERGNWVEVWVAREGGWRLGDVVVHEWGGGG